jgi:hypothetical protein
MRACLVSEYAWWYRVSTGLRWGPAGAQTDFCLAVGNPAAGPSSKPDSDGVPRGFHTHRKPVRAGEQQPNRSHDEATLRPATREDHFMKRTLLTLSLAALFALGVASAQPACSKATVPIFSDNRPESASPVNRIVFAVKPGRIGWSLQPSLPASGCRTIHRSMRASIPRFDPLPGDPRLRGRHRAGGGEVPSRRDRAQPPGDRRFDFAGSPSGRLHLG